MPHSEPLRSGDPERLGNVRLLGRLGEGGQGVVFLGEDADGGEVAVKLLHDRLSGDSRARGYFAKELAAAQQVDPFCTARILAADVEGELPYIVSEYITGTSLRKVVELAGPRTGTSLDRLAIGMATALTAIHRAGVIHRDFKPDNVIMGPDGPRVIDFGIARSAGTQATATSQVIGTPSYMAPEQLQGQRPGPPADVFAWASTVVYAATGAPPFGQDYIPAVINRILNEEPDLGDLAGSLAELVQACLNKDPEQRPSARDVLLRMLGHGEPFHPGPPPPEAEPPSTLTPVVTHELEAPGASSKLHDTGVIDPDDHRLVALSRSDATVDVSAKPLISRPPEAEPTDIPEPADGEADPTPAEPAEAESPAEAETPRDAERSGPRRWRRKAGKNGQVESEAERELIERALREGAAAAAAGPVETVAARQGMSRGWLSSIVAAVLAAALTAGVLVAVFWSVLTDQEKQSANKPVKPAPSPVVTATVLPTSARGVTWFQGKLGLGLKDGWTAVRTAAGVHVITAPCDQPSASYSASACQGFWILGPDEIAGGFQGRGSYTGESYYQPMAGPAKCTGQADHTSVQRAPEKSAAAGLPSIGDHTANYREWHVDCLGTAGKVTAGFVQREWYLPSSGILIVDQWSTPGVPGTLAEARWKTPAGN